MILWLQTGFSSTNHLSDFQLHYPGVRWAGIQMPCWHSRNSSSDLFWPGLMSTPQAPVQPRPYKQAQCHTCLVNSYHPSQDPSHLLRIEQPKGKEPGRADAPHPLHPASEPVLRTSPQSLLLPAPGQLHLTIPNSCSRFSSSQGLMMLPDLQIDNLPFFRWDSLQWDENHLSIGACPGSHLADCSKYYSWLFLSLFPLFIVNLPKSKRTLWHNKQK